MFVVMEVQVGDNDVVGSDPRPGAQALVQHGGDNNRTRGEVDACQTNPSQSGFTLRARTFWQKGMSDCC